MKMHGKVSQSQINILLAEEYVYRNQPENALVFMKKRDSNNLVNDGNH